MSIEIKYKDDEPPIGKVTAYSDVHGRGGGVAAYRFGPGGVTLGVEGHDYTLRFDEAIEFFEAALKLARQVQKEQA